MNENIYLWVHYQERLVIAKVHSSRCYLYSYSPFLTPNWVYPCQIVTKAVWHCNILTSDIDTNGFIISAKHITALCYSGELALAVWLSGCQVVWLSNYLAVSVLLVFHCWELAEIVTTEFQGSHSFSIPIVECRELSAVQTTATQWCHFLNERNSEGMTN